jgi:Flp pilus assembly protein TadD
VVVDATIFITYSSKDQKVARSICAALENRGLPCWISSRNVKPGQNFQEQIFEAIRGAKIMVLVFTANANNSNEIKKELALASQNNLVVIPVRVEDVIPSGAFAYELATRQWIDMFDDWENSITNLVELIASTIDDHASGDRANAAAGLTGDAAASSNGRIGKSESAPAGTRASFLLRPGPRWAVISGVAVVIATGLAYEVVRPTQQPASVSAPVTSGSSTQSEPPVQVASPPSQPAAQPPQQTQNQPAPNPPPAQAAAEPELTQSQIDQCTGKSGHDSDSARVAACSTWISAKPNNAEAYYRRCQYEMAGHNDQAIADFTQAIALKPDYADAYEARGLTYSESGTHHYDKVIADYTQAIALKPDLARYYEARANTYFFDMRLYDNAIADATKAIAVTDPVYPYAPYFLRADIYRAKGQYDNAIADYTQGIALLSKASSAPYLWRGIAYMDKGRSDQAIADFTKAIGIDPDDMSAYYERGAAYEKNGYHEKAIADYRAGLKGTHYSPPTDPSDELKDGLKRLGAKP